MRGYVLFLLRLNSFYVMILCFAEILCGSCNEVNEIQKLVVESSILVIEVW